MPDSIPKIIHQVWLDKKVDDNELPNKRYQEKGYYNSWKEQNPSFVYKLWNIKMVRKLFVDHPILAKYKDFWEKRLDKWIEKCDFARYMLLFAEGGFYADLDFICTKPIDPVLENRTLLILWEPPEHDQPGKRLYNGILGSTPGHSFWLEWMDHIVKNYNPIKFVFFTTGPAAFARYIKAKKYHINHPEWFGNTCWFLAQTSKVRYCKMCIIPKEQFKPTVYYPEHQDRNRYGFTRWYEGTGWAGAPVDLNAAFGMSARTAEVEWVLWIAFAVVLVLLILGILLSALSYKIKKPPNVQTYSSQTYTSP